jgi:hypothetical protein
MAKKYMSLSGKAQYSGFRNHGGIIFLLSYAPLRRNR